MSNDAILRKILNLLNRTEAKGATKNEAEIALKKANQLMTEYNISEFDLKKVDKSSFVEEKIKYERNSATYIYSKLADTFDCEFFYYKKPKVGVFFGFQVDVKVCVHFANMLTEILEYEIQKYKKSYDYHCLIYNYQPQTIIVNFVKGFEAEIFEKLENLKAEREAEILKSTGTSLMCIKAEQVKEAFNLKHNYKLANVPNYIEILRAQINGSECASNINFNSPIQTDLKNFKSLSVGMEAVNK